MPLPPLRLRLVPWLLLALGPSIGQAQLQHSRMTGRVVGPEGNAIAAARVALLDPLGATIATVVCGPDGRFALLTVAPGLYQLRAETPALVSAPYWLAVRDALPVELELRLSPRVDVSIAVSPEGGAGAAAGTTLAGESVQRTAVSLRGNALRAAVGDLPGWTSEDNGLLHYRGADDGLLWVLDGIPVYERLDPQFGVGHDALAVGSVRVLSGYVPPEYGLRSGGVIEVRSPPATLEAWSGALETGAGGHRSQGLSAIVQGPLRRDMRLAATLGGERSRRFLDPVSLGNFHNEGSTARGDAALTHAGAADLLSLHAGHGAASFEVPHDEEQERAGHDQRQRAAQTFATLNWQRSWSSRTVSQLALFGRSTTGDLLGGPSDTPLFAEAAREHGRMGLLAALAHRRGRHRLKAGVEVSRIRLDESFRFHVTDAEAGEEADLRGPALEHTADRPFRFDGRVRCPIYSLYLHDSWRPADALTVDAGLRYDRTSLLLAESQWSPRLGVGYRAGSATFRVSLNRFFQPPQTEYLLLSSSEGARALSPFAHERGTGGAEIHAERQTAAEVGAALVLGAVRVDVAAWQRWMRNQADPNVFFGTTIVFPNSVDRGNARGFDVRLELPRRAGVSAAVAYTLATVHQWGPINGGLFLEDDAIEIGPGTKFRPDHDQRHALSARLHYEDARRGLWVVLNGRYRSGPPLEVAADELAELAERPGADLVDFRRERVKPYTVIDLQVGQRLVAGGRFDVSAQAAVLNVANTRYAFNFGNPFSGTHFGAPRAARFDVRLTLR